MMAQWTGDQNIKLRAFRCKHLNIFFNLTFKIYLLLTNKRINFSFVGFLYVDYVILITKWGEIKDEPRVFLLALF